jgi:hypothetical protein
MQGYAVRYIYFFVQTAVNQHDGTIDLTDSVNVGVNI